MIVRRVWITTSFAGFHSWPAAPEHRAYLRDVHRHLFDVRVTVDVRHDDREVEFHDLLASVESYCSDITDTVLGSCEQIADGIAAHIAHEWPRRRVSVSVSEDGECGATVTHLP